MHPNQCRLPTAVILLIPAPSSTCSAALGGKATLDVTVQSTLANYLTGVRPSTSVCGHEWRHWVLLEVRMNPVSNAFYQRVTYQQEVSSHCRPWVPLTLPSL